MNNYKTNLTRGFYFKTVGFLCAAIFLFGACVALWGCSPSSTYEGKWICCAVKNGSTRYDLADIDVDGASLMTLELKGDGTVSMTAMNEDKDMSGLKWEETSTGITLVTDVGSTEGTYDSESGELTMDYLGQAVILKKQ